MCECVCMCVCVCARERASVCMCVRVCASPPLDLRFLFQKKSNFFSSFFLYIIFFFLPRRRRAVRVLPWEWHQRNLAGNGGGVSASAARLCAP